MTYKDLGVPTTTKALNGINPINQNWQNYKITLSYLSIYVYRYNRDNWLFEAKVGQSQGQLVTKWIACYETN